MAAYLVLKHRETGEVFSGNKLIELDAIFAAAMSIPVDPVDWCLNWMDTIGSTLAIFGDPEGWERCKEFYSPQSLIGAIGVDWFERNFDNISHHGR